MEKESNDLSNLRSEMCKHGGDEFICDKCGKFCCGKCFGQNNCLDCEDLQD